MIILDTNVISELARPSADGRVTEWFRGQLASDLHLTAVTIAELGYGVALLPDGRRRNELARRLDRLEGLLAGRVLSFDLASARLYGPLVATRNRLGRPIGVADAQIAAVCLRHAATLATRNVADFADAGLTIVNPWEA